LSDFVWKEALAIKVCLQILWFWLNCQTPSYEVTCHLLCFQAFYSLWSFVSASVEKSVRRFDKKCASLAPNDVWKKPYKREVLQVGVLEVTIKLGT